jgi:UDP-N-acetylglucosamine 2-epimerase (non-hydrolysing)
MIDTLVARLSQAQAFDVPGRFGLAPHQYAVVTLRRPSNVDDQAMLRRLLRVVVQIAKNIPVVLPVHPRTRHRIEALGFAISDEAGLRLSAPLGYLDFLSMTSRARLVLTDSGGLQEETTVLGVPCVTPRDTTERPITVTNGTNVLVGTDTAVIWREAERALLRQPGTDHRVPDLWDGRTADRIVTAVMERVQ